MVPQWAAESIANRTGTILNTSDGPRRLPLWMKRALDLADTFDPTQPIEDHWRALADFRRAIEPEDVIDPELPDNRDMARSVHDGLPSPPRGSDRRPILDCSRCVDGASSRSCPIPAERLDSEGLAETNDLGTKRRTHRRSARRVSASPARARCAACLSARQQLLSRASIGAPRRCSGNSRALRKRPARNVGPSSRIRAPSSPKRSTVTSKHRRAAKVSTQPNRRRWSRQLQVRRCRKSGVFRAGHRRNHLRTPAGSDRGQRHHLACRRPLRSTWSTSIQAMTDPDLHALRDHMADGSRNRGDIPAEIGEETVEVTPARLAAITGKSSDAKNLPRQTSKRRRPGAKPVRSFSIRWTTTRNCHGRHN